MKYDNELNLEFHLDVTYSLHSFDPNVVGSFLESEYDAELFNQTEAFLFLSFVKSALGPV